MDCVTSAPPSILRLYYNTILIQFSCNTLYCVTLGIPKKKNKKEFDTWEDYE